MFLQQRLMRNLILFSTVLVRDVFTFWKKVNGWMLLVILISFATVDFAVAADSNKVAQQGFSKGLVINADSKTNDTMPAIAVLSDGSTWVAWHAYGDQRDRILARRVEPDGSGVGPVHHICEAGVANDAPVLIAGPDATAWVFWEALREDRWQLIGRQLKGEMWQREVILSDGVTDAMMPAAVTLNDGRVLLAWSQCREDCFRICYRILDGDSWSDSTAISSPDHDSFRPAVVTKGEDHGLVVWDSYRNGNYVVRGRTVLSKLGEIEQISPRGEYALTPTALASKAGICVAWLQLEDVIGGAGVVSQMHTLQMAIHNSKEGWQLTKDDAGNSAAATLTHGIMVKVEPKPQMKLGYMGRCRVPMLIENGNEVWLLWDRKRNPPAHPQISSGELVGRPFRDQRWQKTVVLHQGLIDYHVIAAPEITKGEFTILASELPRYRQRLYHQVLASFGKHQPFQQDTWQGWKPVGLPLKNTRLPKRHEIRIGGKIYRLFWADLHNHGTYTCDAEGEPDEMLRYARDRAQIDVVAITDNDVIFDDPLTEAEYAKTTFHCRQISRKGEFIALPGYEWTSHTTSKPGIAQDDPRAYDFFSRGKLGFRNNHRTVVYPLSGGPLLRHTEVKNDIRNLHDAVDAAGGLALPQHPFWTPNDHPSEAGIEVTTAWGIYFESEPVKKRYHQLLKKYRYGFMGHSDCHRRNPGLAGALTGVYAEELTSESIIEAIRERRMFATNGSRIIIDSRVNGALMGSDVESKDGSAEVVLDVIAPKPIVEVTLIRDGQKVKTFSGEGQKKLHAVVNDKNLYKGTHVYYWRIAQEGESPLYQGNAKVARGHLAWSSPHWVTVGVSKP